MQVWGTGMSAMTWEVNVERTRTCLLDKRMFFSSPPSSQQKTGGVFDGVGQVIGQHSECQNAPIDKLSETEKVLLLVPQICFLFIVFLLP